MNNPENSPESILLMHSEHNARQKTEWGAFLQIAGVVKKKKVKIKKKVLPQIICVCLFHH